MQVLIATDGSHHLAVVSMIEPIDPADYALWLQGSSERSFDETSEQDDIAAVATATERLATTTVEVSHRTPRGQAGPQVVRTAKDVGADLVILGSRGLPMADTR
jgi:nucleotide-binding universal stress UspA family protein